MIKINKSKIAIKICLSLGLFFVNSGWSQEAKIELEEKPLAELPNSISGSENVRDRMNKFIIKEGLLQVKNNKKDEKGRTVLIDFSTGVIAVEPKHPAFTEARIAAFEEALLNAKSQCVIFQKTQVSTLAMLDKQRPPAERASANAEKLKREGLAQEGAIKVAQALNSDIKGNEKVPQIIKTAALYGEKLIAEKMSEEIIKKGLDPNKPINEQTAKVIISEISIKNAVSTVAAARCQGLKVLAAFEQNPPDKKGQIGIVTVWTEKLHAVADAMVTNHWELIPKETPGKSIDKHIPKDLRTLLTTFGTQSFRDDKGDYVVLAFAQAAPTSDDQQDIDIAYDEAKLLGFGLIRSFMGESVETNMDLLRAQTSTRFQDQSNRYTNNSQFSRNVKVVGPKLIISGMSVAHEWETLHPSSNQPVVGVVVQWKVESQKIASFVYSLNQASAAKESEARRTTNNNDDSSGNNSSDENLPKKSPKQRKAESYKGSGNVSRDF
jgi:hypothetical protein